MQITNVPKHYKAALQPALLKKPASLLKKQASLGQDVEKTFGAAEASAGYTVLKGRLEEIGIMKRGSHADQSLCATLRQKVFLNKSQKSEAIR